MENYHLDYWLQAHPSTPQLYDALPAMPLDFSMSKISAATDTQSPALTDLDLDLDLDAPFDPSYDPILDSPPSETYQPTFSLPIYTHSYGDSTYSQFQPPTPATSVSERSLSPMSSPRLHKSAPSSSSRPFSSQETSRLHRQQHIKLESDSIEHRDHEQGETSRVSRQPATSTRRRAQNRKAQRAFRERKEQHAKELERNLEDLTERFEVLNKEHEELKREYERIRRVAGMV